MSAKEFAASVQAEDTTALVRLPGIGKKTAQRLIVEMRDRLDKLGIAPGDVAAVSAKHQGVAGTPVSDAVGALIALGYRPNDASRLVRAVDAEGLSSEEIIRASLKSAVTN